MGRSLPHLLCSHKDPTNNPSNTFHTINSPSSSSSLRVCSCSFYLCHWSCLFIVATSFFFCLALLLIVFVSISNSLLLVIFFIPPHVLSVPRPPQPLHSNLHGPPLYHGLPLPLHGDLPASLPYHQPLPGQPQPCPS